MSVLLVVNSAPYGSEEAYNAFRLAEPPDLRDEHVEVFLMGDAVDVDCCDTRCATRGLTKGGLVAHTRVVTIHDLAEATVRSDRIVSF